MFQVQLSVLAELASSKGRAPARGFQIGKFFSLSHIFSSKFLLIKITEGNKVVSGEGYVLPKPLTFLSMPS